MLKELTKNQFERVLKAEMEEDLGDSKYGRERGRKIAGMESAKKA